MKDWFIDKIDFNNYSIFSTKAWHIDENPCVISLSDEEAEAFANGVLWATLCLNASTCAEALIPDFPYEKMLAKVATERLLARQSSKEELSIKVEFINGEGQTEFAVLTSTFRLDNDKITCNTCHIISQEISETCVGLWDSACVYKFSLFDYCLSDLAGIDDTKIALVDLHYLRNAYEIYDMYSQKEPYCISHLSKHSKQLILLA